MQTQRRRKKNVSQCFSKCVAISITKCFAKYHPRRHLRQCLREQGSRKNPKTKYLWLHRQWKQKMLAISFSQARTFGFCPGFWLHRKEKLRMLVMMKCISRCRRHRMMEKVKGPLQTQRRRKKNVAQCFSKCSAISITKCFAKYHLRRHLRQCRWKQGRRKSPKTKYLWLHRQWKQRMLVSVVVVVIR